MTLEDMYVRIYKALAHPVRIKIVRTLRDGPLCVCTLNENVEFSQSNLSQHLKILKDAGILKSDKDGIRILYSIKDDEVKTLLNITDKMIRNEISMMNSKLLEVE
jgi:DNA-binding transcriptional ArsR family regulator